MTFYELEKRASKAPWKTGPGFTLTTGKNERYVAQFDASETPRWAREDAVLAAHCRNNFGKALEALELAIEACVNTNTETVLRRILAELETVEVWVWSRKNGSGKYVDRSVR